MSSRYNYLVQTGKIDPFDFQFQERVDKQWECTTTDPILFSSIAARKRDAKEAVIRNICEWYEETQTMAVPDIVDPGRAVWVLVDGDSCPNTLKNMAQYEHLEWLEVQGFINGTTSLGELPWHVYQTRGSLREAADHLLTWHTAQLVQTLTEKTFFIVVSRDAALQNTVEFIKEAGHDAVFCPRDLKTIQDVLNLYDE